MKRFHHQVWQHTRDADDARQHLHGQEVHSYPAGRRGVSFLVDVRLTPEMVVIEADAPTLTKDDVKA